MTEHTPTYRDTTWRAELMGSEGWAVFVGPRMLASCLWEHQARFIVTSCNCHAELLEALKEAKNVLTSLCTPDEQQTLKTLSNIVKAIRHAKEQA
ncbi:MAG: hypothetical protein E3J37_03420 [Anaerolineales bacterium]|nr:MAG: hypothetical protein E3J37_03420 [Anaerolineales bacterium]